MSDDDETTSGATAAAAPDTEPGPGEQSRWARWRIAARERARRTRKGVVLAVAGALLVGVAGGFAAGALATGEHRDHRGRPGDHASGFEEGRQGPPPGVPGQLPPTTREDDSGLTS
jgi:hypothetical protein